MEIHKSKDNTIKNGRIWIYLNESFSKNIGIEYSLRFNPFNFYLSLDGGERDYTFCFWFIFTFYITFHNVFKYYPKEWNSVANNSKGGYLDSATRKIGISQYNWSLTLYLWHDGEDSWYNDKCDKIYYKYIDLFGILFGGWILNTIEEGDYDEYIHLNEGKMKIDIHYRFWYQKYNRFYMKLFNNKGKSIYIKSDIKYPIRKQTQEDIDDMIKYNFPPDELERVIKDSFYLLKEHEDKSVAVDRFKDNVIKLRSCEDKDWVPFEYRKKLQREKQLKDILE